MMKPDTSHSSHTSVTVDETVDTRTVDIDMDIIKMDRTRDISSTSTINSRSLTEKWTGLNDTSSSHNINIKLEDGSGSGNGIDESENTGSISSEPRRTLSRRNSNESVRSIHSSGSAGSSGSKSSAKRKTATKRRSWKKPKDKPKRPLSAYNIFFKHTRSRIVEGFTDEGTAEETIASIEGIVANSTETRRHRKTHGQISFGDLARTIADKWKNISKTQRAVFDHYAALDMKRYRRDVSIWKAKKESEALAAASGANDSQNRSSARPGSSVLDNSVSSSGSHSVGPNYMIDSQNTIGVGENYDDWNTPQNRALSTSFNSIDSEENFGMEPLPIADLQESAQNNSMIGRSVPSFIGSSLDGNGSNNNMMDLNGHQSMNSNNNNGYNHNLAPGESQEMHNKKLRDIWMKNRQLEDSINKLKKELSGTDFHLGGNNNNNNSHNNMGNGNIHPDSQQSNNSNSKFLNTPFPVGPMGPSIDRMHQLHRRRLLMGDILPQMGSDQNNPHHAQQEPRLSDNSHSDNHGNNQNHNNNFEVVQDALINVDMELDPFDLNPVPFEEVFNSSPDLSHMKKKELITNLSHLTW